MIDESIMEWALRELADGWIPSSMREGPSGFYEQAYRILNAIVECPPDRFPVICNVCDPPSVKFVLKGAEINNPYICSVCIQRISKRTAREAKPMFGRMGRGR